MFFDHFCAFHVSSCPNYATGFDWTRLLHSNFAVSGGTTGRCCWRGLALSLLQAEPCGNHYTWKKSLCIALSHFFMGQGGWCLGPLSVTNPLQYLCGLPLSCFVLCNLIFYATGGVECEPSTILEAIAIIHINFCAVMTWDIICRLVNYARKMWDKQTAMKFHTLTSGWFQGFSRQNNRIACGFAWI